MSTRPPLTPAQIEALQARFALRVGARLDHGARDLPHDVTERLRVARQQALAAAAEARRRQAVLTARPAPEAGPVAVAQPALALASAGTARAGTPSLPGVFAPAPQGQADDGRGGWLWRMASVLPVVALVLGLWGIATWQYRQQVRAAAEVDTALLTDTLPPAAYSDPGFEEFLRSDTPATQPGQGTPDQTDGAATDLPPLPDVQAPDTAGSPQGHPAITA